MKKTFLLYCLCIYSLLSAQYDQLDQAFNASYQGLNKGLSKSNIAASGSYIYSYQDSLFLIVGNFDAYNDVESHNYVWIDRNGEVVKNYPIGTDLVKDEPLPRLKSQLALNGQFIYRLSNTGKLSMFGYDGRLLLDSIYTTNSPHSGIMIHDNSVYVWDRSSIVKIVNDVEVYEVFIDSSISNPRYISDVHYSAADSSFILSIAEGNPFYNISVLKYNNDGNLDADFTTIHFRSPLSKRAYFTKDRIFTLETTYVNNNEYVVSKLVARNSDGKIDSTFSSPESEIFLIDLVEDIHENVFMIHYPSIDLPNLIKYSKYGVVDDSFALKLKPNSIYIYDFLPIKDGRALVVGQFDSYDNQLVGSIAMMRGLGKYDCNNLTMDISKLVQNNCDKKGYVKFKIDGGKAPYEFYLNDSLVASLDSITIANKGYHTVKVIDASGCTQSITFLMTGDFQPISYDLSVSYASAPLVRGFEHIAWIDVANNSCKAKDARVSMTLPSEVQFVNALPAPLVVQGNVYTWHADQLLGSRNIVLTLKTSTSAQLGELKKFEVKALPSDSDINPSNNSSYLTMVVQGSFDPNDIASSPSSCDDHFVKSSDRIRYTIRFQNIGNFPAKNIYITDSLSPYLDINTVEILSSSHTMHVEKMNDKLKFIFNDINLPGKDMDEAASNGYVVFDVAMTSTTPLHTKISNEADIFFDFNEAVKTNSVFNTLTDSIPLYQSIEEIELCVGESYSIENVIITKDTSFQVLKYATNGCDSLVYYSIKVKPAINHEIKIDNQTLVAVSGYSKYIWINCDTGEQDISESNSNVFTPKVSGQYAVIVVDGKCLTQSPCVYFEVKVQRPYMPLIAENKYWFYKVHNGSDTNPPFIGQYVLHIGADTLINNTTYSRLLKSNLKGSNPCQSGPCFVPFLPYQLADTTTQGYLRENLTERKVYFLPAITNDNHCSQDEYLAYDFDLAVNDSLPSCLTHIVTADLYVDSIRKAIINKIEINNEFNADRVVWHFNGVFQSGLFFIIEMKLIEGVGIDLYNGFYNSPHTFFYNFCEGSLNECNILNQSKETSLDQINIYPNPFTNVIHIDTDLALSNVRVTNALGQLVYKGNTEKRIDLANQSSGMYYVAFTADGKQYVYSVVKH